MVHLQSILAFLFHLKDSFFFGIVIFGLFANYIISTSIIQNSLVSLLRIPFPHANVIVMFSFAQVEHEQWYLSHKFYQNQIHSTLKAWARDRDDMLVKVKATFAEAWTVYEEATEKAKTRKKQENICQDLYKKVYNNLQFVFRSFQRLLGVSDQGFLVRGTFTHPRYIKGSDL